MLHPTNDYHIKNGNFKDLARALTRVENELLGSKEILFNLDRNSDSIVLGVTGPPGAGKSTLVNSIINQLTSENKFIAVLAIDPTSPFNLGALLGDRIRMAEQFNKPNVFIRSLATRGSLGGLSAKTIEMVDVLKSFGFDYIIVETVGVGQSEVEIVGLADITLVVLVPESGDEIQSIKSGLMEIADIFVVNKSDRAGADIFFHTLEKLVHLKTGHVQVLKTIAHKSEGITDLLDAIKKHEKSENKQKPFLLAEKAWKLIQQQRMIFVDKRTLQQDIAKVCNNKSFNLYKFVEEYEKRNS